MINFKVINTRPR